MEMILFTCTLDWDAIKLELPWLGGILHEILETTNKKADAIVRIAEIASYIIKVQPYLRFFSKN